MKSRQNLSWNVRNQGAVSPMLEVEQPSFWGRPGGVKGPTDVCLTRALRRCCFFSPQFPLGPFPCALARVCSAVTSAWQTTSMLKTRDTSGAISEMLEMEARSASRSHPCPRCPLPPAACTCAHIRTHGQWVVASQGRQVCKRLKPRARGTSWPPIAPCLL